MSALQLAWIIFAIGMSSGTLGGLIIGCIGLYGICASAKDDE